MCWAPAQVLKLLGLPERDMALITKDKEAARIHVTFMGKGLQPDALKQRLEDGRHTHIVGFRPTGALPACLLSIHILALAAACCICQQPAFLGYKGAGAEGVRPVALAESHASDWLGENTRQDCANSSGILGMPLSLAFPSVIRVPRSCGAIITASAWAPVSPGRPAVHDLAGACAQAGPSASRAWTCGGRGP